MAERLGDAVLDLRTDDTSFDRGIKRAQRQAERLDRTFQRVGRSLQELGRNFTLFVTTPIVTGLGLAVKAASDVQELRNLIAVTFGDSADAVEEWAKRTADAIGRSRFDLLRTAGDFAAFLKPLGVAPDLVAPLSKQLTQLTTDVASFRNMADQDVFEKFMSGLAGETEAVRRLGIDIGQAALEQELFNLGIRGGINEATQAQKVLARFNLIIQQTGDAQGDAARTAGSFENRMKALWGLVRDIAVAIGSQLLPKATELVDKLIDATKRFLALEEGTKRNVIIFGLIAAAIGPLLIGLGLMVQLLGFGAGGLVKFGKVILKVGRVLLMTLSKIFFGVVRVVMAFLSWPGLIAAVLAGVIGSVIIFKDTLVGAFKGTVTAVKNALVGGFNNLVVRPFQKAINSIVEFLPDSVVEFLGLQPMGVNDVVETSFVADMKAVMAQAGESAAEEWATAKEVIGSTVGDLVEQAKAKFKSIADSLGISFGDLSLPSLDDINAQIQEMVFTTQKLPPAASAAGEAFADLGDTIKTRVEDGLTDALSRVRSFGDAAREILRTVMQEIIRVGLVQRFITGPTGLLGNLFGGARAEGGPVSPGKGFLVGERGPELFMPRSAGTVVPNHELSGRGGLNQTINVPLAFPPQLEAFVRNVAGPAGRDAAAQLLMAREGRI